MPLCRIQNLMRTIDSQAGTYVIKFRDVIGSRYDEPDKDGSKPCKLSRTDASSQWEGHSNEAQATDLPKTPVSTQFVILLLYIQE